MTMQAAKRKAIEAEIGSHAWFEAMREIVRLNKEAAK